MSFNVPPARNRALRIDFSPETLQAKVQELETYRTLVQKTQRLQEAQKRKEDLAAKKLLRTEMKLAARLLKRAELEASKVSKSLSQAEQQAELAATRRRESILQLDIAAAKAQSRCNELSTVLSEKFAEVAEAKSRLTNVELQAQMMELGVALHGLEPQVEKERVREEEAEEKREEEAAAVYEENQRLVSEVRELRAWRSSEEAKEGSASEQDPLGHQNYMIPPSPAMSAVVASSRPSFLISAAAAPATPRMMEVQRAVGSQFPVHGAGMGYTTVYGGPAVVLRPPSPALVHPYRMYSTSTPSTTAPSSSLTTPRFWYQPPALPKPVTPW